MSTTTGTTARTTEERRALARVPLDEPRGVLGRLMKWYAQRTYGDVPDPGLAMLHNPPVLKAVLGFERRVDKWDRLDPDLKVLGQVAAAAAIGCSWCLDFGSFAAPSTSSRRCRGGGTPGCSRRSSAECWSTPRR